MELDPVCKMIIDKNKNPKSFEYENQTHYFCSTFCKELFSKNPDQFLTKKNNDSSFGLKLQTNFAKNN